MKNTSRTHRYLREIKPFRRQVSAIVGLLAISASPLWADVVYVSSSPQGCTVTANCPGPNSDGTYTEIGLNVGDYGARGTAPGRPALRPAPRGYISSTSLTDTTAGIDLKPILGVPGGVYQIDYNFSSTAGNTSTNVIMSASAADGTLSFTQTDKFQRSFGNPANQWQFMGYLTNAPGSTTPTVSFRYLSGVVNGGSQNRLIIDCWRFTLVQPCLSVPVVNVTGPLSTNSDQVVVTGVSDSATALTVYQDSGSGMVQIGTKASNVASGTNSVTVTGLVKGAQVAATQTISNQEGCVPPTGTFVGSGANPSIRVAITINDTAATGPVGASASGIGNLHFIGATGISGGAPVGAMLLTPSTNWQTVTLGGRISVSNSANATGTLITGSVYSPSFPVAIQVYAYKNMNGGRVYSPANGVAQSDFVGAQSPGPFSVRWSWDAVPGADGYRVLRDVGGFGFVENYDVTTNSFDDIEGIPWGGQTEVLPDSASLSPTVQWNVANSGGVGSVGSTNGPTTPWGILESINFVIDEDVGPFDIYIDDVENSSVVFQTFEDAENGATDYGFRAPSFSGTTSDHILTAPNVGRVTNLTAFAGQHSFNTQFEWSGTNSQRWLRLTTFNLGNPQVNLANPISFRILLLPVGTTITPPAQPPTIGYSLSGDQLTLTWTGSFNLQSKDSLSDASWSNVGVSTSPYTTTVTGGTKFYRLQAP